MTHPPSNETAAGLVLPAAINMGRSEDLEKLFARCAGRQRLELDGSGVRDLDSRGFEYLVNGIEQLILDGVHAVIATPSPPLRAARSALRLDARLPFADADEEAPARELALPLKEVLVQLGILDAPQVAEALTEAGPAGLTLPQVLLQRGLVSDDDLAFARGRQHGIPFLRPVGQNLLDVTIEHGVPLADLRAHGVLPFLQMEDLLAVAVLDPSDVYAVDTVRQASGLRVYASVTTNTEIQAGLDLVQRTGAGVKAASQVVVADEVSSADRFDGLLLRALIEGASDIHLEPDENCYLLRYRVDGRLHEVERYHITQGASLCARIKVMADCDISEKRLPQDGRIHFQDGSRDVDLRVNTLPTVYGEKAVLRILDRTQKSPALDQFGFSEKDLDLLRGTIHAPFGLVLVTGPTGSGKTTTLYSVLSEVVGPEINVSTVENPVERSLPGVNQTQVNTRAGLDFSTCLRALLRQDPDVIMIGEIRDTETAEIAVEASLTGHLVLATLHTNDAPSAATRLIQMGIEPFLVSATLRLVMAQRLVRRLCEACKRPANLQPAVLERYRQLGLQSGRAYTSIGCAACRGHGYAGRLGVFEIMNADEEMRELLAANPSSDDARDLAINRGMTSLLLDGIRRVNEGKTSLEEALRAGGTS